MQINKDEPLWVEKYRPQTVAETILPKGIKDKLQSYVDQSLVPNSMLTGGPGIGKTTAAKAMFNEMKADYYFINSSMHGNIDTLRTDISDFASAVSFTGKRKYVLLDEADYLNPNSTQPALRGVIEEFSRNCGFILTCNYAARLIEPLHSRCPPLDLTIPAAERATLAEEFFMRVQEILHHEKVSYQPEVIAEVITLHFPDWRRVLNILQNSVKNGAIGSNALSVVTNEEVKRLFTFLKKSNFSQVREWASQHGTDHPKDLFRTMYGMAGEFLTPAGQAQIAVSINKFEYHAAFVANQEINLVAALVEIMTEAEFK